MKELLEYKQIGTLEELKQIKDINFTEVELAAIACSLEQLKEYEHIGTLEEVREVVERQQAKKPSLMLGIYGRVYECKECGNELEMYSKHCPFCGQKQEWE